MRLKDILALFFLASPSSAFFSFKAQIPNGGIVPHPCKANYLWEGVGHLVPSGGGERNAFGKDFNNAGRKWTEELCRLDSDGDGMTNGEELGDPNCKWKEGTVPERVTRISHPGVCTPYGEGVCLGRDSFVDCSIETFGESCDIIKDPNVQTINLQFQTHTIPNTETNYYCQYFDLPRDKDYHIVANEGLIINREVVHHMLVFGCPDSYNASTTDNSPNPCSMRADAESCSTLISLWTVGIPGTCFGDKIGFRFGANAYKKVRLEIHYNNPMLVSGYKDNSGFKLYYRTAQPSVQDLTTFVVGQTLLKIPPGKERTEFNGSCPSDCTSGQITKPIKVVTTVNHMHYLGRSQKTEVTRNGQVIKILANDEHYSYDSPKIYNEETPFEILPGDEVRTTCVYNTMSRKEYTYFGDATSDEMCFAFLTVYPAEAFSSTTWCESFGPMSLCDWIDGKTKLGCDWSQFGNFTHGEMAEHWTNLATYCRVDGTCRPKCREAVQKLEKHPCLQNEMNHVISAVLRRNHKGALFLGRLYSCLGHDNVKQDCKDECSGLCNVDSDGPADNGSPFTPKTTTLVIMILVAWSCIKALGH